MIPFYIKNYTRLFAILKIEGIKMKIKRLLPLCSLAILILILVSCSTVDTTPTASGELYSDASILTVSSETSAFEVHFIDVGQADAALVLCDDQTMLIDGGNAEDSNWIYTYLDRLSVTHLDYIVATHAHEDHIGGIPGALTYATVGRVLCPTTEYDSEIFDTFKRYVSNRDATIEIPQVGESFSLGSATVDILACNADEDTNNTSIVLKITYGETFFLFTGDAEREVEQFILESGADISSTVLKVGHHGSRNSTTYPFLNQIMPDYAIISVGKDNSYGHPTEETLSRLANADVTVYRTDLLGSIICSSDGQQLAFRFEKNNAEAAQTVIKQTYILNTNTHKFHYESCDSVDDINPENKDKYTGTRDDLIKMDYEPCGNCDP